MESAALRLKPKAATMPTATNTGINAAGFSTKVVQFEEIWQLHGSGLELAVLEHAQEGLARYKALVHERLQRRSMLTPSGTARCPRPLVGSAGWCCSEPHGRLRGSALRCRG